MSKTGTVIDHWCNRHVYRRKGNVECVRGVMNRLELARDSELGTGANPGAVSDSAFFYDKLKRESAVLTPKFNKREIPFSNNIMTR